MTAQPKHNRKLVLGGVSLTNATLSRNTFSAASAVRDRIEKVLIDSEYLKSAPFSWIGIIIRYGIQNELTPNYRQIDTNDGELPLAIEVDSNEMIDASIADIETIFQLAVLKALIHAGEKFDRPVHALKTIRDDFLEASSGR